MVITNQMTFIPLSTVLHCFYFPIDCIALLHAKLIDNLNVQLGASTWKTKREVDDKKIRNDNNDSVSSKNMSNMTDRAHIKLLIMILI
jgi:hypothetical protein